MMTPATTITNVRRTTVAASRITAGVALRAEKTVAILGGVVQRIATDTAQTVTGSATAPAYRPLSRDAPSSSTLG